PLEGRRRAGRAGPEPDAGAGRGGGARVSGGFFRSRWVEAPRHVRELTPTALPAGFRAGAAAAGLKPSGLDVGVLVSDEPGTVSAARFTSNSRVGAPVIVSRESALDRLRAVVANAGGSNTGDGQRGVDTARAVQDAAALAPDTVELLTGVCVKRSFDRISVDGQLSTSDTVFVMANGASGVEVEPESADELLLGEAIDALMRQLAMEIVADGEGARR